MYQKIAFLCVYNRTSLSSYIFYCARTVAGNNLVRHQISSSCVGLSVYQLTSIAVADYADQEAYLLRPLPSYNSGYPEWYSAARPFRDNGPPGWAGVNSPINPPLSDEEYRSHFGFAAHLILEVLDVLQLPASPGRLGPATFPFRFDTDGTPTR